jgi:hypothetical protein
VSRCCCQVGGPAAAGFGWRHVCAAVYYKSMLRACVYQYPYAPRRTADAAAAAAGVCVCVTNIVSWGHTAGRGRVGGWGGASGWGSALHTPSDLFLAVSTTRGCHTPGGCCCCSLTTGARWVAAVAAGHASAAGVMSCDGCCRRGCILCSVVVAVAMPCGRAACMCDKPQLRAAAGAVVDQVRARLTSQARSFDKVKAVV